MAEYTLVDSETGLIYGPYETCAMARAHAEGEALAAWEIIKDDNKLVDWSRPDSIARPEAPLKNVAEPGPVLVHQESPKNAELGGNASLPNGATDKTSEIDQYVLQD